jgi:hypothetical protein
VNARILDAIDKERQAWAGRRYGLLRRRRNHARPPLRVYWWNRLPNFGDRIMPDTVRRLFGYRIEWAPLARVNSRGSGPFLGGDAPADSFGAAAS